MSSDRAAPTSPGGPTHVLLDDRIAEHVPGCNMAFRREALLAIGGFNPIYLRAGDDVDVCWRLQARGGKIGFASSALVWHHHRASVKAYWRRQLGYGEGETWLMAHHPEKFLDGRMLWRGRIYSPLPFLRSLWGTRINAGVWGTAAFPSVYRTDVHPFAFLPHSIRRQIFSFVLTMAGTLVAITRVHQWAAALLLGSGIVGLAATVTRNVAYAMRSGSGHARRPDAVVPRHGGLPPLPAAAGAHARTDPGHAVPARHRAAPGRAAAQPRAAAVARRSMARAAAHIWMKRQFVGEMIRLVEEPGAVLISHAHNELAWSPSHGQPLSPEGYRDLFETLPPRIFGEAGLFADLINGGPLNLARRDSVETLDADPALTLIASRHPEVFAAHPLERPAPVPPGEYRLSPLYVAEPAGDLVRLRLQFPSGDYEEEYAACRQYLPQEATIDQAAWSALAAGRLPADLVDLVRRRVMLDLPLRYY